MSGKFKLPSFIIIILLICTCVVHNSISNPVGGEEIRANDENQVKVANGIDLEVDNKEQVYEHNVYDNIATILERKQNKKKKQVNGIDEFLVLLGAISKGIKEAQCPKIISRAEWNARPPKSTSTMTTPVPVTVIHHSGKPACNETCITAVKEIQDLHMDTRGWYDIGYNFLIGGHGQIYEGRGWQQVGAHAGPNYNHKSIGICLIGNFTDFLPLEVQLNAAKSLIQCGVDSGYIVPNYTLYGHRDVRNTTCPGQVLYEEIEGWPHKKSPPTKNTKNITNK